MEADEKPSLETVLNSAVRELTACREDFRRQNARRNLAVIVAIAIAVVAVLVAVSARQDLHTSLRNAQHTQCEGGNEFRRLDRQRWEYIASLTDGRPVSQEAKKQRENFLAYIVRADKLRDCSKF